tara:strand:+ start:881 stop:1072 length:192 start_codon:yes stop_codon:yes gene_type:complete
MANSGIMWIDTLFNSAVIALYRTAEFLGITYEEINVYLFCILWPITMVVLVAQTFWIVRLTRR